MALLFADGFDHYDTAHRNVKWDFFCDVYFGEVTLRAGRGRDGGGCIEFQNQYEVAEKCIPQSSTVIAGCAFRPDSRFFTDGGGGNLIHIITPGGMWSAGVAADSAGRLSMWGGDGTPGGTQSLVTKSKLYRGAYQYLELKLVGSSSGTGTVTLRQCERVIGELTGLTQGLAHSRVAIGPRSGGIRRDITLWADDFYICDGTGDFCNDFLGDVRVLEAPPTGDGYYTDWASTGANHYGEVDDPADALSVVSRVRSRAVGNKDTYTFDEIEEKLYGNVLAVVMNYFMEKQDSGARKLKGLARADSVDENGTEIIVASGAGIWQSVIYEDPAAEPWTIASINAAEFGQELSA